MSVDLDAEQRIDTSSKFIHISTTCGVSLLMDQVPEDTCNQVLRYTSVDLYGLRASKFSV